MTYKGKRVMGIRKFYRDSFGVKFGFIIFIALSKIKNYFIISIFNFSIVVFVKSIVNVVFDSESR
jgi:hypothetical protein